MAAITAPLPAQTGTAAAATSELRLMHRPVSMTAVSSRTH